MPKQARFQELLQALQHAHERTATSAARPTKLPGVMLVPVNSTDAAFAVCLQVALEELVLDLWGPQARQQLVDFFDARNGYLRGAGEHLAAQTIYRAGGGLPALPELDTTSAQPQPNAAEGAAA